MVKKESAKRGYMTKEEINEHIGGLNYAGKIGYLRQVLKKPSLLSPKTREYVSEVIVDLSSERDEKLNEVAKEKSSINRGLYSSVGEAQRGDYLDSIKNEYAEPSPNSYHEAEARMYAKRDSHLGYLKASSSFSKAGLGVQAKRYLKKARKLENIAATTSIIAVAGILAGIFFLSSNITGNAIADLSTKTTSFLGAGLLIVGLVAGFFWVKSKIKYRKLR